MPEPLKILIVEDHKILCESLALLVGTIEGVEVIGKTANGRDALSFLEKPTPPPPFTVKKATLYLLFSIS